MNELRELDAWIAEHLFGWEWLQKKHDFSGLPRKALLPPDNDEWIRWNYAADKWEDAQPTTPRFSDWDRAGAQRDDDRKLGNKRIMGLPHYTTDRAAAMEVLERCVNGFDFPVEISQSEIGQNWYVHKRTGHGPKEFIGVEAETLPLCVCMFAKKLFGKE